MCELLFILQRISVTNIIMFMISVLPVCCALLNFESFIHGHFYFYFFNMFLFVFVLLLLLLLLLLFVCLFVCVVCLFL